MPTKYRHPTQGIVIFRHQVSRSTPGSKHPWTPELVELYEHPDPRSKLWHYGAVLIFPPVPTVTDGFTELDRWIKHMGYTVIGRVPDAGPTLERYLKTDRPPP